MLPGLQYVLAFLLIWTCAVLQIYTCPQLLGVWSLPWDSHCSPCLNHRCQGWALCFMLSYPLYTYIFEWVCQNSEFFLVLFSSLSACHVLYTCAHAHHIDLEFAAKQPACSCSPWTLTGLLMMSCSMIALLLCCFSFIEFQESFTVITWGHSSHADYITVLLPLVLTGWLYTLNLGTIPTGLLGLMLVQACHTVSECFISHASTFVIMMLCCICGSDLDKKDYNYQSALHLSP